MQSLEEIDKIPFVFIVAKGRSGTTLLQNILDSNSSVVLPLESSLIIHLKQKYYSVVKWNSTLVDAFIHDLYKEKKFARYWNVNKEELKKKILSFPLERMSFSTLCKIVYLSYPSPFAKENIRLIGDKNPIYLIFINELISIFPEAKFIHLIRDHRDNIVSNKAVFEEQSVSAIAESWRISNEIIEESKKAKPQNFYTLKYEDLVTKPEEFVREICDFIVIPFSNQMLDFYNQIDNGRKEKFAKEISKMHPNILKPVNADEVNKWQRFLSPEEISLSNKICINLAKRYGYLTADFKTDSTSSNSKSAKKIRFDFYITKTYFKMPFWLRDFMGSISSKLFKWFNYSSVYNHEDFRFKK